ncbi:DUF1564 family protein [Leptospira barantonii]|uniref:DUF1564 family protein n=1 Tax=Leptospira barantonii TaxID=2023184 RepID=A0ABX4NFQ6_9LEPT|nr:DUF1564 family protein [Leptospira barantonii]PJZ55523.1 hypothetical protein CH367_20210 [Leptospira barantonii]
MENVRNLYSSQHTRRLAKSEARNSLSFSKSKPGPQWKRLAPSDLWVPKNRIQSVERRIAKFGSLKKALHFLLKENRNRMHSLFKHSQGEKTIYQSTNLELIRFSFRPDSADWAELRITARYYGVSICNFFVLLLTLDEKKKKNPISGFQSALRNRESRAFEILLVQQISSSRDLLSFLFLVGKNTFQMIERESSA